ncbi:hypothetical protein [Psychromonas sp.]|uniref:hypothetical protein n=1 Tax=Psychromonas sp. TaxID=1884585 RepID=UPI0039E5A750
MPLIKQIREAVNSGDLSHAFTTQDIILWVSVNNITKDDGDQYVESSITSILSNSSVRNTQSSNQNVKVLGRSENAEGKAEYWFLTE